MEEKMDVMEVTLSLKEKSFSMAFPIEQKVAIDEYEEFFEKIKKAMLKMVNREYFNLTGEGSLLKDPWQKKRGESLCVTKLAKV